MKHVIVALVVVILAGCGTDATQEKTTPIKERQASARKLSGTNNGNEGSGARGSGEKQSNPVQSENAQSLQDTPQELNIDPPPLIDLPGSEEGSVGSGNSAVGNGSPNPEATPQAPPPDLPGPEFPSLGKED